MCLMLLSVVLTTGILDSVSGRGNPGLIDRDHMSMDFPGKYMPNLGCGPLGCDLP